MSYSFRAAAFHRVVANVYTMTKEKPEDFLGRRIEDGVWEKEEDQVLVSMICEMNWTGANSRFMSKDEEVMKKVVLKVIRAFWLYPELYGKFTTCFAMQAVGTCVLGHKEGSKASDSVRRAVEVRDVSKMFHEMAKEIFAQNANFTTQLSHDEKNEYMTLCLKIDEKI
jgi:hypothetical protein